MDSASRQIAIRLSLEDAEKIRAELRGIGSQGGAALKSLEDASAKAAKGADEVTNRFGLARYQLQNLTAQVVDFGVQISSGQGLFLPLVQQGPQAIDAMGGLAGTFRVLTQLVTPLNVGIVGTAAVLATATLAAERSERALNDLSIKLRATRADFADAARQVEATARTLAGTTGLTTADAREAGAAIRGVRGFSGSQADLESLVRTSEAVAKTFGTTVPQAAALMADALNKPGQAARQLAERDFPAMDDALRRQIQLLEAAGQKAEAQRLVMDALAKGTAGATDDITPFQRALEDASKEATGLWNAARPLLEGLGRPIMEGIAEGIGLMAAAFREVRDYVREAKELWDGFRSLIPTNPDGSIGTLGPNTAPWNTVGPTAALTTGTLSRDASSRQILDAVRAEAQRQGVDAEFAARVAIRESRGNQFRPDGTLITSRAGAQGVMQLMPGTAAGLGVNATDTADNIRGGVMYLAQMLQKYAGDQGLAAAAYNAGPGRVDAWLNRGGTLPAETIAYMGAVSRPRDGGSGTQFSGPAMAVGRAEDALRGQDQRSQRLAEVTARAGVLESALQAPRLDPADATRYREALEKLRAETIALRDPMEEVRRRGELQARLYQQQAGAARDLAAAEQQGAEQARGAGKSAADQIVAGLEARAQKQAALDAQFRDSLQIQQRATAGTREQADAMQHGASAAQDAAIRQQAEVEGLKYAAAGTDLYRQRVEELVRAKREQKAAETDLGTAGLIAQQRDQITLLEREAQLIGLSTEARQAELAVLKERQRVANGGGDPNSATSLVAQDNIRRIGAQQTANQQLTNSWNELARVGEQAFDRIGNAITEAFVNGQGKAVNFGNIAKAVFSEVIQAGLRMAVINPVLNGVFGGTRGTLGGITTVAGGGPTMSAMAQRGLPVTDANATVTGFNQRGATDVAGSLFDTGNSVYSPGYSFSSGYIGKADGFLRTNVGGWLDRPAFGGVEAFGPNTGANPTAPLSGGVTYGQAIAGGASIVGGAYGIWQGAQTGGAKGWAQGIGGAAGVVGGAAGLASAAGFGGAALAGVATVAPYVALIAAVVAQFLPAAKPSNREGNSTIDLGDGSTTIGGATGSKYSDENRAAARGLTDAIKGYTERLTTSYGLTATGRYTVGVGDRDGMYLSVNGGRQRDYKADEEGTKNLLREVSKQVIESAAWQFSGPMATTYATVGTGDIDRLLGALDWTKGTYQAFLDNADPAKPTAFAQSLKQVSDAYDPLIAKAREYGLAIEPITAVMDEQLKAAERARNMQFEGALQDMGVAASQLRGGDLTAVTLSSFDRQRTTDWLALMEQVKQMGLGEADQAKATASFDALRDLQRTQVQRNASRAYEDQQATLAGLRSSSDARFLRLQGRDAEADALDYAAQRRTEETALRRQLEDFGASAQEAAAQLQIFAWETAKGAEAVQQAARDNAAGQAAGVLSSLSDYARSLQTSDAAPGTVLDRLAAAQSQYERTYAAALGGDASAIGSYREAAETYRGLARETYGGGQGYADVFRVISSGIASIAEMGPEQLTQAFVRENDRLNTDRLVNSQDSIRAEIAALRRDLALVLARP